MGCNSQLQELLGLTKKQDNSDTEDHSSHRVHKSIQEDGKSLNVTIVSVNTGPRHRYKLGIALRLTSRATALHSKRVTSV